MSSFKRLKKSDVFTIPYIAHKNWSFTYNSAPTSSGYVVLYEGERPTSSFDPITSAQTSLGEYENLLYKQINQLYYHHFTESLNTHSLMMTTTNYESASSYRQSSSYFLYNDNPGLVVDFPNTGSFHGQRIQVFSIPKEIYGEKITPGTFQISTSIDIMHDDGKGNLIRDNTYVGNIFYSQGLAIITNQAYQFWWYPIKVSFQGYHTVYENFITCLVEESEYNLTYNPSLRQTITSSSSSIQDFATGSVFAPYATTIGLYNDSNELLMVAKLAKPILISSETDQTFLLKYDT